MCTSDPNIVCRTSFFEASKRFEALRGLRFSCVSSIISKLLRASTPRTTTATAGESCDVAPQRCTFAQSSPVSHGRIPVDHVVATLMSAPAARVCCAAPGSPARRLARASAPGTARSPRATAPCVEKARLTAEQSSLSPRYIRPPRLPRTL